MEAVLEGILKDIFLVKPSTGSTDRKWQYPFSNKLSHIYNFKDAQSLLELSHRVSVHNWQTDDSDPVKLDPPNFDIILPINTTLLYIEEVNVLWFFYSTSLNIAMITYTGTYCNMLYLVDLNYTQQDPIGINNYITDMKIHGGFWAFYQNIQSQLLSFLNTYVNKDTQLVITGMSLGGAMSTITMLDLYDRKLDNGITIHNIVHYSFASPRVFNTKGAKYYNSLNLTSHRIQNASDIITTVPFPVMMISVSPVVTQDFTHVNGLQYFDINLENYYDNHIQAYLKQYKIVPVI